MLTQMGKKEEPHLIDYEKTFIPAAYCKDVYADNLDPKSPNYDATMADEFSENWVCPNVKEFELLGDPWYIPHTNGSAIVMEIVSCT